MPDDPLPPLVYRPHPLVRSGGALVLAVAAMPSLMALAIFASGDRSEGWPISLIASLLLGGGAIGLLYRWWNLSACLDGDELILRGPIRTRRFPYRDLGDFREVWVRYRFQGRDRSARHWVLLDRNGREIAEINWRRLLCDFNGFETQLRHRIGVSQ